VTSPASSSPRGTLPTSRDFGGSEAEIGADVRGLHLDHVAPAVLGFVAALLQLADDDDAVALGQRLGCVRGEVLPRFGGGPEYSNGLNSSNKARSSAHHPPLMTRRTPGMSRALSIRCGCPGRGREPEGA
jgi:hypothetical protein